MRRSLRTATGAVIFTEEAPIKTKPPRLQPEASDPPFVWSDSLATVEADESALRHPLIAHLESARSVFGVVTDMDGRAVEFLLDRLESDDDFRGVLILGVYPACATSAQDLEFAREIEARSHDRVRFRILPVTTAASLPNTICIQGEGEAVLLNIGATANLGFSAYSRPSMDVGIAAEPLMLTAYRRWFEAVWGAAAPLDDRTTRIPALIPARGSEEAAERWRIFQQECVSSAPGAVSGEGGVSSAGDVQGNGGSPAPGADSPIASLGLHYIDETAEAVVRLFRAGQQAIINPGSRMPPLDAPMRPEWFGIDGQRQVGAASREIKYRISVLDANTLRELDKRRKRPAEILRRLGYPLGNSVYWVPHEAKPLVERELTRANDESRKILDSVLPGGAQKFIEGRQDIIARDANAMYREFYPGGQLAPEILKSIFTALTERLEKAQAGRFLPQISYSDVQPRLAHRSDWESGWGQALVLLQAVAEMPRQLLTEPRFLWGLKVEEDEWLDAMDVAGDALLAEPRPDRRRAEDELRWLDGIESADAEPKAKCKAILSLLAGNGDRAVQELCAQAEEEHAQDVGPAE